MAPDEEPDDGADLYINRAFEIDPLPVLPQHREYEDAICVSVDPDAWYPQIGEPGTGARKICRTCPAQVACLQASIEANEKYGIWGGLSPRPRRAVITLIREGYIDADFEQIAFIYNENYRDPYWYRILVPEGGADVVDMQDFRCCGTCEDPDECTCDGESDLADEIEDFLEIGGVHDAI